MENISKNISAKLTILNLSTIFTHILEQACD
jgi:hypothetical protein